MPLGSVTPWKVDQGPLYHHEKQGDSWGPHEEETGASRVRVIQLWDDSLLPPFSSPLLCPFNCVHFSLSPLDIRCILPPRIPEFRRWAVAKRSSPDTSTKRIPSCVLDLDSFVRRSFVLVPSYDFGNRVWPEAVVTWFDRGTDFRLITVAPWAFERNLLEYWLANKKYVNPSGKPCLLFLALIPERVSGFLRTTALFELTNFCHAICRPTRATFKQASKSC